MKALLSLLLAFLLASSMNCRKNKTVNATCFKGKLQKKGICMNYTISIISAGFDTSLVEPQWTDPNTGISYNNAFRLGSVCSFPSTLQEGAEFYFTLAPDDNNCAVCQAFYPTPKKTLSIKVAEGPCTN